MIDKNLFEKAGVSRVVAATLSVLSDYQPHTMREIERDADLRQPEVSTALKSLSAYIKVTETKNGGCGRPFKTVSMTKKNFQQFLDTRVEVIEREHLVALNAMERIGECM